MPMPTPRSDVFLASVAYSEVEHSATGLGCYLTTSLALGSVEASGLLRRLFRGFDNHKVVRVDTVGDGWLSKGLKIAQGSLALVCNILTGASVTGPLES